MKRNHAIGLGVPAKKAERSPPLRVPGPYGRMLLRLAAEHLIGEVELFRRAGYYLKKPGDRASSDLKNGKAALKVGVALRRALVDLGIDVPAIFVTENDELSRWAIIGDRMRTLSHDYFVRMMEKHDEWVSIATSLRENERTSGIVDETPLDLRIASITKPLPREAASSDRPSGYRRQPNDGQADEEALGPPRAAPVRTRRRNV